MPGDTNLAMFRVSKIEEKAADTVGEPEGELENDGKSDSTETSSTSSWKTYYFVLYSETIQLCFAMPFWYKAYSTVDSWYSAHINEI